MKKKIINKIIAAKIKNWTDSIEDESVREAVKKDVIVTGGCICSMLLNESISDFDVYFKTLKTAELVTKYYLGKFAENPPPAFAGGDKKVEIYYEMHDDRVKIIVKSAGVAGEESGKEKYAYFEMEPSNQEAYVDSSFEQIADNEDEISENPEEMVKAAGGDQAPKYRPVFLSTNAITLSNKIQIIIRFIGEPDKIHENYDYVHCTNYWTPDEGVVLRSDALEAILTRELRYVGSKYPLCSIIRARKFIKRGWTINAGQFVKMCMQLNEMDLTNLTVLEDQLTGVDVAYFIQVLDAIREKKDLSSAYVIEIIDRIF